MATQESRHFALSTVSSDLGFNRKTSLFYQGLDSPTFSGALFHPKQSAPDGHPVSVGIYSTDFLDYDPQNTRSHDLDGQFEPVNTARSIPDGVPLVLSTRCLDIPRP